MLNAIPIVGTAIDFLISCLFAVPSYFLWSHVGPIYFYWLPKVYQTIPFWDIVWIFMTLSILKVVIQFPIRVVGHGNFCEK